MKKKGVLIMADSPNVVARFSDEEKAALVELAMRFHRSQTGILRALVCEAVAVLREQDARITPQMVTRPRAIAQRMKSKNLK
jgi:hypothetical protein